MKCHRPCSENAEPEGKASVKDRTEGNPPGTGDRQTDSGKKSAKANRRPLVYLGDIAPEFDLPRYEGERYEATVPDTYDIHERALAVQNVLTRAIDPEWDYLMYFRVEFACNPAIMWHGLDDQCQQKYMQALDLHIRIPGWADLNQVRALVNDAEQSPRFSGRYLEVGRMRPGDVVSVRFPIGETSKYLEIEKSLYRVVIRGADVVEIDPPGVRGPFYQRDHYRRGETRWHQVRRFAPATEVEW